nr:MAG TPA: hypothetical protein [Caudoviricetes sp.]
MKSTSNTLAISSSLLTVGFPFNDLDKPTSVIPNFSAKSFIINPFRRHTSFIL